MKWTTVMTIPGYLFQGITDVGMDEEYNGKERVMQDDLRIAIILSGGYNVVAPPGARIIIYDEDIDIQVIR